MKWSRPPIVARLGLAIAVALIWSAGGCAGRDGAVAEPVAEVAEPVTASRGAVAEVAEPVAASRGAVAEVAEPVAASRGAVELAVADFLDQQSFAHATAVVEAMAADGDERWVPWLVDLLRADVASLLNVRIGEVLEAMTGVESGPRIPNLIAHGSWFVERGLDGGDGYRDFKLAIYSRFDTDFVPLLASVPDQATLAAIQWGGVPVGGIPELNDPARLRADQADWMVSDEVVVGVVVGDTAVAYPLRILERHELVNDTVGSDPLAIVYCTLCRSAAVFDRRVGDATPRFLTSGLLLNSNKIMVDDTSLSLWNHLGAVGIGGEHLGRDLTARPVNHFRWSEWMAAYPDSEVLALPDPIYNDNPERPALAYDYTPGSAYRSYYDSPGLWFPTRNAPDTLEAKTEVVGIVHDGDAVAVPLTELEAAGGHLEVTVGGTTYRVSGSTAGAQVFDRSGRAIVVQQSFWFAWFGRHPDTRVYPDR